MTEKGLNVLRKIAAESFPNMVAPPGGWTGPDAVNNSPPVRIPSTKKPPVKYPNMKTPEAWKHPTNATADPGRKPSRKPRDVGDEDLEPIYRQIDNDPTIKDKEAEKAAVTERWNQRNFR